MDWGDVLECSICLEQLSESNKEPVLTRYYPSARQTFMKWENVYPRKPLFNLSMLTTYPETINLQLYWGNIFSWVFKENITLIELGPFVLDSFNPDRLILIYPLRAPLI